MRGWSRPFRPAVSLLRIGALAPEVFAWDHETPDVLENHLSAEAVVLRPPTPGLKSPKCNGSPHAEIAIPPLRNCYDLSEHVSSAPPFAFRVPPARPLFACRG